MDKIQRKAIDITSPRRPVGTRRKMTKKQWLLGALVLLAVMGLAAGIYWYWHRNDQVIMTDRYQVVLLDDGKIFFGKLQNTQGNYLTLKDPYYAQGNDQTSSGTNGSVSGGPGVKIFKVTNETYGPEDSMSIQISKVQFWQNLRADSKVAKAIQSAGQPQ